MSKLSHNKVAIILMVIAVIVVHPLPSSATDSCYSGDSHTRHRFDNGRPHQVVRRPRPKVSRVYNMDANDPSGLFDQLHRNNFTSNARDKGSKRVHDGKGRDKLVHWLNSNREYSEQQKEDLLVSSALAANRDYVREHEQQQERRIERLQNAAADQEFEHMMKLNFQRDQNGESCPVDRRLTDDAQKNAAKKIYLAKALNLCKQPNKPKSCDPSTTNCQASKKTVTCTKKAKQKQVCPAADRLLKISRGMKKRALLIIKILNLLDLEILNRWPSGSGKPKFGSCELQTTPTAEPQTTVRPPPTTSTTTSTTATPTTPAPKPTPQPMTTAQPTKNTEAGGQERLEKPKPISTTPSPFKQNHGFYFGLQAPDEESTDASMATALKEEQKLEQKVREEHLMQRENARLQRQLHRKLRQRQLKMKRKLARFETAPPEAARLELIVTKPPSVVQGSKNISKAVRSSVNNMKMGLSQSYLRNNPARQPLKNAERCKRRRHKQISSSVAAKNFRGPTLRKGTAKYERRRHEGSNQRAGRNLLLSKLRAMS